MTIPLNIRAGWIQISVSPQKRFDNPETTEMRDHLIKSIKFLSANNQTSSNATNRFD
jgi:hypothetical protein